MVHIGIVGLGFMGMTHFRGIRSVRGGKVAALCSRDPAKLRGDWRGIRGNFGEPGGVEDLSDVRTYERIADILADPAIDLIDICLPTSLHCDVALQALRAGKHVLVEKPISLDLREADRMVRKAAEAGRRLMVAHVLPFVPEYAYLIKVVGNGAHGALLGAHFRRTLSLSSPTALQRNLAQRGGPGIDLHIHDTHYVHLLCGMPDTVCSSGHLVEERYAQYLSTLYRFQDRPDLSVTCVSGAVAQPGRGFTHGFEAYLEKATVAYDSASTPLSVFPADGTVRRPRLGRGDPVVAFTREIQAAVDAVSRGTEVAELSGERAADALRLCLKEIESVRRRRAAPIR